MANVTGFEGNSTIYQSVSYHVDLREFLPEMVAIGFSAATGLVRETHTLLSWEFSSVTDHIPYGSNSSVAYNLPHKKYTGLIVGSSAAVVVLSVVSISVLAFTLLKKRCRVKKLTKELVRGLSMTDKLEGSTGLRSFHTRSWQEQQATFRIRRSSEKEDLVMCSKGS